MALVAAPVECKICRAGMRRRHGGEFRSDFNGLAAAGTGLAWLAEVAKVGRRRN
jgi:hypothetical protein